jgi:prevent-host-death family protein
MSRRPMTLTARQFSRDLNRAKRAAMAGPVIITDLGRPTHVLLSHAEYRRLTRKKPSILELLAQPGGGDFEFEPPRLEGPLFRPVEFD